MSSTVRTTPCLSQRLPDVMARASIGFAGAALRKILLSATSSISSRSGYPPTDSNNSLRTNSAWSPVQTRVSLALRFMQNSISRKAHLLLSILTSNQPHCALRCALKTVAPPPRAASIKAQAEEGNVVSPCRKSNTSPVARTAPAFICEALPFGALSTLHW